MVGDARVAVMALVFAAVTTPGQERSVAVASRGGSGLANGDCGVWEELGSVSRTPAPVWDDGSVAFLSSATNLADSAGTGLRHVYRRSADGAVSHRSVVFEGSPGTRLEADVDGFASNADGTFMAAVTASSAELFSENYFDSGLLDQDVFLWDDDAGAVRFASSRPDPDYPDELYGGNGASQAAALSMDGRWLVFSSAASDLVTGDSNGAVDLFLYDRVTGALACISRCTDGAEAGADSDSPSLSADGGRIAFQTYANGLPGDGQSHGAGVYVYERDSGALTKVSRLLAGGIAADDSDQPQISGDGGTVVYRSAQGGRVPGDGNGFADIFACDLSGGVTERVSVSSAGSEADGACEDPAVSGDGRFVVFTSTASNLTDDDTDGYRQVFLRDRAAGTTELISTIGDGEGAGADCFAPAISPAGRYVTFASKSTALAAGPDGRTFQVFVVDRGTDYLNHRPKAFPLAVTAAPGGQRLVHLSGADADGDALTYRVVSLPAGRLTVGGAAVLAGQVVAADALPLVYEPPAEWTDGSDSFRFSVADESAESATAVVSIRVRDYAAGPVLTRVSENALGEGGDQDSGDASLFGPAPSISADGSVVGYVSGAKNLVAATYDSGATTNGFLYDVALGTNTLASMAWDGRSADGSTYDVSLSGDGRLAVLESTASNLVWPETADEARNLFVRDLITGASAEIVVGGASYLYCGASFAGDVVAFLDGDSLMVAAGGVSTVAATGVEPVRPGVSWTGEAVCFASTANLDGDDNGAGDGFVYYRPTGAVTLVTGGRGGQSGDGNATEPVISGGGRFVAFTATSTNLTANGDSGTHVYVRDLRTGSCERISSTGTTNRFPAISAGGRFVCFASYDVDAAGWRGYRYDRHSDALAPVAAATGGASVIPHAALSANGRYVAFVTDTALTAADTEGRRDLYLADFGDPVNTLPRVDDSMAVVDEDASVTVPLTAADGEDDDLVFEIVRGAAHGIVVLDRSVSPDHPEPTVVYTPAAHYSGSDSFSWRCRDGEGFSAVATVTVTVREVNDVPELAALSDLSVDEGETKTVPLTVTDADAGNAVPDVVALSVAAGPGAVVNGAYTYAPGFDVSSAAAPEVTETVTIRADDGRGGVAEQSFTLTVRHVDRPPVMSSPPALIPDAPDRTMPLTVTAAVEDPDGEAVTLEYRWFRDDDEVAGQSAATVPALVAARGEVWKAAVRGIAAGADTGWMESGTVTIGNAPPAAAVLEATVQEDDRDGEAVTLSGSDPDGDDLEFVVTAGPGHGAVTGTPPNVRYVPDPDYFGVDSFGFVVTDGEAEAPGTVSVTVAAEPDAPELTVTARLILFDDEATATVSRDLVVVTDADSPGGVDAALYKVVLLGTPTFGTLRDRHGVVVGGWESLVYDRFPLTYTAGGRDGGIDQEALDLVAEDPQLQRSAEATLRIVVGAARRSATMLPGWNLLALAETPLPEAAGVLAASPVVTGRLWGYNARRRRMVVAETLGAGRGFWVFSRTGGTVGDIPADPTVPAGAPLVSGWNLIGSAAAGRSALPNGALAAWRWDATQQRYVRATALDAGFGCWVWLGD